MEKEAQMLADQDTAAGTATHLLGAAPSQSRTSHPVGSSTETHPQGDLAPASADPTTNTAKHNDSVAGPRSQTNTTADADTTTRTVEKSTQHTPRGGRTLSFRASWRSWSPVIKLTRWLSGRKRDGDFDRHIRLIYNMGHNDVVREAVLGLDTKCPGDWIRMSFLQEAFGLDYSKNPSYCVANNGGTLVYCFGQITLRWSGKNPDDSWLPGNLHFEPKTYTAVFDVVETTQWDVLFGGQTLDKLGIVTVNDRFFGYYDSRRPAIPKVTPGQAANSQARVDEERAAARRSRLQAEEQSAQLITTATATATTTAATMATTTPATGGQ
ncbi:hypothetical protein BKA63DRAFT_562398 [Paraphoma chrysanthemicola]|nr:hypothetical protein BKA63DRAFT_562398 [Paraphoma chrysanthemicola]